MDILLAKPTEAFPEANNRNRAKVGED